MNWNGIGWPWVTGYDMLCWIVGLVKDRAIKLVQLELFAMLHYQKIVRGGCDGRGLVSSTTPGHLPQPYFSALSGRQMSCEVGRHYRVLTLM